MRPQQNSIEYYRARESRERALAQASISPAIAAIHLDMAERYVSLVGDATIAVSSRPRSGAPA